MSAERTYEITATPDAPVPAIRRTPLFDLHVASGGHMVPFSGWEMPLYYTSTGILGEHRAVREGAGMFDVSHMGIVSVEGPGAAALLARRSPGNALSLPPGRCRYSFILDVDGRILDDVIYTRLDELAEPSSFLFVPNAGTTPKVLELLLQHRPEGCRIERHNGSASILAVQGPRSREVLEKLYGWDLSLKPYTGGFFPFAAPKAKQLGVGFAPRLFSEGQAFVSRTGYTGELGFEVFVPAEKSQAMWKELVAEGVVPCGLGARDTLRMEKGFLLSGVDFHHDRTPLEASMDRFLDFDHKFVGREALEKQRADAKFSRWTGIRVDDPAVIPRHGTPIFHAGAPVATVSSGCQSPTLKAGIALAYLPPALTADGTVLELEVRGKRSPAKVVPLPFVPNAPVPRKT